MACDVGVKDFFAAFQQSVRLDEKETHLGRDNKKTATDDAILKLAEL